MGNISSATATHKPPLALHDTTNLSWNIDWLIIRFWKHQNPSRIFFGTWMVPEATENGIFLCGYTVNIWSKNIYKIVLCICVICIYASCVHAEKLKCNKKIYLDLNEFANFYLRNVSKIVFAKTAVKGGLSQKNSIYLRTEMIHWKNFSFTIPDNLAGMQIISEWRPSKSSWQQY